MKIKKFASILLALVMVFALTATAFAQTVYVTTNGANAFDDNGTDDDGATSWVVNVPASYANDIEEGDVAANYYVVVTWEVESRITYTVGTDAYKWEVTAEPGAAPTAAGYNVDLTKGTWSGDASVTVNVENWSNRAMTATLAWASKGTEGNVVSAITAAASYTTDGSESADQTIEMAAASASVPLGTTTNLNAVTSGVEGARVVNIATPTAGALSDNVTSIGTLTITLTETA